MNWKVEQFIPIKGGKPCLCGVRISVFRFQCDECRKRPCEYCGERFYSRHLETRFCSRKCSGKGQLRQTRAAKLHGCKGSNGVQRNSRAKIVPAIDFHGVPGVKLANPNKIQSANRASAN